MENNRIENEGGIFSKLEEEYNLPHGFLTKIISLENEHIFQLRRRGAINKIENIISNLVEKKK